MVTWIGEGGLVTSIRCCVFKIEIRPLAMSLAARSSLRQLFSFLLSSPKKIVEYTTDVIAELCNRIYGGEMSANDSRPLILSIFLAENIQVLADSCGNGR